MKDLVIAMNELIALNDIDWFDRMCNILEKKNCPTTNRLTQVIGIEDLRFSKENRGSKFFVPFDKRFKTACINPDISCDDVDQPLDYLSFGGIDFILRMPDVLQRFHNYKTQRNIYDGGSQLFFFPVPQQFAFTALSFRVDKEPEEIGDINQLIHHHVAFHFGDNVVLGRDGYHVRT